MNARRMTDTVSWLGAIDWDRRIFDSLIPLPDGTSYNAFLIEGQDKTVLIDTVDPAMTAALLEQLEDLPRLDYVISQHAEQDHSGAIGAVLERFPEAQVLATPKAREMLPGLLDIPIEKITSVKDGETLSLGDRQTLKFVHTPWVHWPETMVTYLQEERILFTCDMFGAHIASSELYATDEARVLEAAKRYYGEIMLPFRKPISRNLEKIAALDVDLIAPSHGPLHSHPDVIIDAYHHWTNDTPSNLVALPYISMHGSTGQMVDHLTTALMDRGVAVERFDLTDADLGKIATALVDAGTIVIGTPTVLGGPHPNVAYVASLANALRPKAKYLSVVGSYGWGGRTVETLAAAIPNLKVELLEPVLEKGHPTAETRQRLDNLADQIARHHQEQAFESRASA